jgi:hypothetical protein
MERIIGKGSFSEFQLRVVSRVSLCLLGLLLVSFAAHAVEVLSGPTLTMDPNGLTPLAGVVELETDVAVAAQLTITDGLDLWTVRFPSSAQQHYLPVLGLKADRTYSVDVELVPGGPAGTVLATTAPLPDGFPVLTTTVSIPAQMEPGYTLMDCLRRSTPNLSYTVIVDSWGAVVWYTTRCMRATRQLPNGNLFYRQGSQVIELDLLANERPRVQLDHPGIGLHHDLFPTPHGTYLSLDRRSVEVDDFPTSETDPRAPTAPATLLDDSVVEFLPDGTLRREWPLVEMLDITRIGYDSLVETANGLDWTHANAVTYRLEDDSIVVSVRHQDAVIKFSRRTGKLQWILGPHDNWSPEFRPLLLDPVGSPFRWQFHQHAPMWTPTGTLLLFDNGNRRASPFDGNPWVHAFDNFSRGVEFKIDEDLMTVEEIWEYGERIPVRLFSFFISDADWLPTTGNRLMTFGGTEWIGGVHSLDLGLGLHHTRIVETAGNTMLGLKVFELIASDPDDDRLNVYRSERIPSLYPQQDIKVPAGIGNSLMVDRVAGQAELSWKPSPATSAHDAADYYILYSSIAANSGFSVADSTAFIRIEAKKDVEPLVFYKIVAANISGTSGDEPAP